MPSWYYDKQDLYNTPSHRDGYKPEIEARYRREGARFILDLGKELGLRCDTCSTGVVYFHRFYMNHSFKQFHRYVTGVGCLFLAGKVEETPKKCSQILQRASKLLTKAQFQSFGSDPKEEIMTMERILLQTIKFDLMVEHPYKYLVKYGKILESNPRLSPENKKKIQKMVPMAWTFINDSMCTTLCLQWEADMLAVALLFLASKLTKFTDIQEVLQTPDKKKWFETLVEDASLDLLEDVCHQVLDLYSQTTQKPNEKKEDSPPPPPPAPRPSSQQKRSRTASPVEHVKSGNKHVSMHPPAKHGRMEAKSSSQVNEKKKEVSNYMMKNAMKNCLDGQTRSQPNTPNTPSKLHCTPSKPSTPAVPGPSPTQAHKHITGRTPEQSSSFMSQEGCQSIRNLVSNVPVAAAHALGPSSHDSSSPAHLHGHLHNQQLPVYPPPAALLHSHSAAHNASATYPPPSSAYQPISAPVHYANTTFPPPSNLAYPPPAPHMATNMYSQPPPLGVSTTVPSLLPGSSLTGNQAGSSMAVSAMPGSSYPAYTHYNNSPGARPPDPGVYGRSYGDAGQYSSQPSQQYPDTSKPYTDTAPAYNQQYNTEAHTNYDSEQQYKNANYNDTRQYNDQKYNSRSSYETSAHTYDKDYDKSYNDNSYDKNYSDSRRYESAGYAKHSGQSQSDVGAYDDAYGNSQDGKGQYSNNYNYRQGNGSASAANETYSHSQQGARGGQYSRGHRGQAAPHRGGPSGPRNGNGAPPAVRITNDRRSNGQQYYNNNYS